MPTFGSQDIPDLHDQVIIVTGGNAGLGYETIRQLSKHNPAVIYLAARSQHKAEKAIAALKQHNPESSNNIRFLHLDLASFDSIKAAAAEFLSRESRLDILINNAGIMMTPPGLTKDGQARMVMLSSAAHAQAPSDVYKFDELRTTATHRHTTARYTTSKLANLHYARALAERESDVKIVPVHPGMVATNLHHASTGTFLKPFLYAAISLAATPVTKGALSQIFAAVSPGAKHGQYYGPIGKAEAGSKLSQNHDLQEKLFKWNQRELSAHVQPIE